ncbi:hypothetical protein FDUTEX481_03955 [Tolypothrix sp. PCC 7601]|nr:hypothetical protein FDUTEX481_03955 [Tolypothrix sp. PCC 7601]
MVWGKGERVRVKGLFLAPFPLPLFPLTDKYWVLLGFGLQIGIS